MVIKGNPGGNVMYWAKHLTNDDKNERAELKEIRGLAAGNLQDALWEMKWVAAGSRSQGNFLYQANINVPDFEHLSEEQWTEAFDTLEKNLGLEGHQRVIVEHEKEGRVHRHAVWNRVDVETMRVTDMKGNYRIHAATSRELELKFALTRTPNPGDNTRPGYELWEMRAADRSGIDPAHVTREVTALWKRTDSGQAFAAALEESGYLLAKGDSRDFCILDRAGDVHSLARRIDGVNVKDLRERMSDIKAETLPTVEEARVKQRGRDLTAGDKERVEIRQIYLDSNKPGEFNERLMEKGFQLAIATDYDVEQSKIASSHAETRGHHRPVYRKGEFVIVSEEGRIYRLNKSTTGESGKEVDAFLAPIAKVTPGISDAVAAVARERPERDTTPRASPGLDLGRSLDAGALMVLDTATGVATRLADFMTDFLIGTPAPIDPFDDPRGYAKAVRNSEVAMERIREHFESGRALRAEDLRSLTPEHLMNIAAKGDDYIKTIIHMQGEEQKRAQEYGRQREQ